MIVCKIMADFDSPSGNFSELFDSLAPLGAILCPEGNSLFFASSVDSVDKKKVKRLMKKHGYPDSVVVEYGIGNPPKETPAINGWVFDYISQNAIIRLGRDNRDAIRAGIDQLDKIDAMITEELSKYPDGQQAAEETEAAESTED